MSINGNVGRSIPSLLTQISGSVGYQSKNLWYFLFDPSVTTNESGTAPSASSIVKNIFILGLIQDINIPFPSIETESTNLEFNYASGYKSSGDIKITFLETQLFQSLNYLQSWFNSIYNMEGKYFEMNSGKRNGNLLYTMAPLVSSNSYLADSLLGTIPNAIFRFEGMMLKNIDQIDASYSADLLKLSATFSVDRIIFKPLSNGWSSEGGNGNPMT